MSTTPPFGNTPPGTIRVGTQTNWVDAQGNNYTPQITFLQNFISQNRVNILTNQLPITGFLPTTNWAGSGVHHPGILFGRTSAYSHNGITYLPANNITYGSGTYKGRLVPQGYIEQNPHTGVVTFRPIGILPFNTALQATSRAQGVSNATQAANELGLVAAGTVGGLRRFTRPGYNGYYYERNDGGIYYDGGTHVSGVRPPEQIYYTGTHMWHRVGPDTNHQPPAPTPALEEPIGDLVPISNPNPAG